MVRQGWIIELPQAALQGNVLVLLKEIFQHPFSVLPEVISHEAHVRLWFLGHTSTAYELLSQRHSILACKRGR